jgi:hypothetical protein
MHYTLTYPEMLSAYLHHVTLLFKDAPLVLTAQFAKIWSFLNLEVNDIKNLRVKDN